MPLNNFVSMLSKLKDNIVISLIWYNEKDFSTLIVLISFISFKDMTYYHFNSDASF